MYHQDRFKTRYCSNLDNPSECVFGSFCSFVHDESEFRIKLLHKSEPNAHFFMFEYKTVMCPMTHVHNRMHCVYAHNQQDFRRRLASEGRIDYREEECKNWRKNQNLNFYIEGGCPDMMACKFSHGWKEHDYHAMVYKTR